MLDAAQSRCLPASLSAQTRLCQLSQRFVQVPWAHSWAGFLLIFGMAAEVWRGRQLCKNSRSQMPQIVSEGILSEGILCSSCE